MSLCHLSNALVLCVAPPVRWLLMEPTNSRLDIPRTASLIGAYVIQLPADLALREDQVLDAGVQIGQLASDLAKQIKTRARVIRVWKRVLIDHVRPRVWRWCIL